MIPPGLELAAAACRPPGPGRDAAVRAAAEGADWPAFLAAVERHRIPALARAALTAAGVAPPAPIGEQLERRATRVAFVNLALAAETSRLQRLFDAAGLPFVTLKGAALALLAYGSLAAKQARDIDVLTTPERALEAWALIEADGYLGVGWVRGLSAAQRAAIVRFGREVEFARPGAAGSLELSWRPAENPMLLAGVQAGSPTIDVPLPGEGRALRTLAEADNFAYLSVHGARHGWARLKWLADLNAFVEGRDIAALVAHARRLGARLCAGQALVLCRDFFGRELPPELAAELDRDPRVQRLVRDARAALAADVGFAQDAGEAMKNTAAAFHLGAGWRFAALQAAVSLFGPTDVIQLPLPGPLAFLYPVLHLPLWLWRRFAPKAARRAAQRPAVEAK